MLITVVFCSPVNAANEYLQQVPQPCTWGSFEPYVEYGIEDGDNTFPSDTNNNSTSGRTSGRVGFRLNFPLQSTCTKEYRKHMIDTYNLMRELELLKKCQRFKNLELGPQFNTVKTLCKGIKMKPGAKTESIRDRRKRSRDNKEDYRTVDEINDDAKVTTPLKP